MNISEALSKLSNEKFVLSFYQELQKVFGELPLFLWDIEWNIEETTGWAAAFFKACKENNLLDIYEFGNSLDWYDIGQFYGEVNELFATYKLAFPENIESFLERKYQLPEQSIIRCWSCGKSRAKEEGHFDVDGDFHCNDCSKPEKYTYSIEELGLNIPSCKLQSEEEKMEYYRNILKEMDLYKKGKN